MRQSLAIALLAAVSIASAGKLFLTVSNFYVAKSGVDGVTQLEDRLSVVRSLLPRRGTIGYTGEWGVPPDDPAVAAEYFVAQYSLAPIVVSRGLGHRFILANFHKQPPVDGLEKVGLFVYKDFGQGLMILQNVRVQ